MALFSLKIKTLTFAAVLLLFGWQGRCCPADGQTRQKPPAQTKRPALTGYNADKINALRPEQVKMLRFYGGTFFRFSNVPVETHDPALIRRFLHAIRYPVLSGSVKKLTLLNRSDILEIYLRNARKGTEPLEVRFLGRTNYPVRDCFGPEFVAALHDLGRGEARRYAALAGKLKGAVVAIAFNDPNASVIRDKAKIAQFLTALKSLDAGACAYGDSDATPYRFDLTLKNGKEQEIDLLVPKSLRNGVKGKARPVWLWPYDKAALTAKAR